jgi:hypothetical protein
MASSSLHYMALYTLIGSTWLPYATNTSSARAPSPHRHRYLRGVTVMVECTGGASVCDTVCTGCGTLPGQTTTSLQTSIKPGIVIAHGSLLIVAWAFCAPIAALIKRHAATLPSLNLTRKVRGFPLAFLLHASIMSVAAMLTIVAVGLAFSNFKWRAIAGHGTSHV